MMGGDKDGSDGGEWRKGTAKLGRGAAGSRYAVRYWRD